MANLGFTINQNDLPEDNGGDFAPLPAGEYNVRIAETEIKTTKSGTGQYIKLRLDVIGPTHEGRVLFSNLNIKNDSQKAEEIGRQQLGTIMRAINLPSLQDTDQLVGGMLTVKVAIRKSEEYGDSNDIKAYKAMQGSAAPQANAMPQQQTQQPQGGMSFGDDAPIGGQQQAQAAPAAPAGGMAPPWAKK